MTLRGRDAERETAPTHLRKPRGQGTRGQGIGSLPSATREDLNKQLLSLIPSLRAFARVLTRNPSEVDDLVQDTLVKAISNIHQFTPGTNLRAWLFTIERNTFYTALPAAPSPPGGAARRGPRTQRVADPGMVGPDVGGAGRHSAAPG